jgi:mRNA interferase MazF
VVSPDELNDYLRTVLVAPLTTGGRTYRTRVACSIQGKEGHVALDQLRVVDKSRLGRFLGPLTEREGSEVLRVLRAMFAQ